MATWYLIIAFTGGGWSSNPKAIDHIEFTDKAQCELVASIVKQELSGASVICVKDRSE